MKKKNGKARVFLKLISCFSLEREREREKSVCKTDLLWFWSVFMELSIIIIIIIILLGFALKTTCLLLHLNSIHLNTH